MNLLSSATVFSFFTLISRFLGYIRDILIAFFLGASIYADAFLLPSDFPTHLDGFLPRVLLMQLLSQATLKKKSKDLLMEKDLQMTFCSY